MSDRAISDTWFNRIKAATRDLVKACGGVERSADLAHVGKSTVARWYSLKDEDIIPISAVLSLEADCDMPFVTQIMADLNGRSLTDQDAVRDTAGCLTTGHNNLMGKFAELAIYEWLTEINSTDDLLVAGIKPRRSALLFGPPGTGKTTLAHHLAARLGVPLVAVQSEQLVESSLGGSGRNIAELFTVLSALDGKCVVLLDEIDSIGSRRSKDDQAAAREMNGVLTTLLRYVENFAGVCIAATNQEDSLDPALWRRFGMQIPVLLPAAEERYAILQRYSAPFVLDDADVDVLCDMTYGASPALLRGLMEGIKRTLILSPKIRRDISDPRSVIAGVLAAVRPPPEMEEPPLWQADADLNRISAFSWPPRRSEAA